MYELDSEDHPAHQLRPLRGGRYKTVLKGPPGTDIGDLHCDLDPYVDQGRPLTVTHSGWMPTEEQQRQLAGGAHVRLSVWQHPIPPLAVSVEPPVCGCHGEPMAWDSETGGYYCPVQDFEPRGDDTTSEH